ncbi:MAG TPA: GNAT family N-acetyltransferase [Hyphomicrobium sp.]
MSITIRPLEERDRAQWEALFRAYIRFYQAKVPDNVIDLSWRRVLKQEDGFLGLVAEDDGRRLVGLAHLLFHRSTWSPTHYCYLEDLFVDIDTRRQGVGRALIEATYREADRRGATRTYWATMEGNSTARRLYDRLATLSPFVQYRR